MTAHLATRAALASVGMATVLLMAKGYAAFETGSVAMLGSLADTALDLIASLVTLWGVRIAAQPADHDHRFGHGKAEALAALFQVIIISLSAIGILWQAIERLTQGNVTAQAEYGIGVSLIAIAATFVLLAYQRHVIAQTGSLAIGADHVHYQSDLLLNIAVIVALALDQYVGVPGIDPLFGIAIALWLIFGAWRASSAAIDQLMDKEWPEEKRARFLQVAALHPEMAGIHDLRTRTSGAKDFVQFHVWVAHDMTIVDAHRVMDQIEDKLRAAFPGVEILIHSRSRRPCRSRDDFAKRSCPGADPMKLPFVQVDAFADRPFSGNPAAVMILDAWLDDATLQAIAAENNLAETAFLVATHGDADYELRWFTPSLEVALCGHATLASGHVILSGSRATSVKFRTCKAGILEVRKDGTGYELDLPAWGMTPEPRPDIAALIGGQPVESHWRDGGYSMLVYASEGEVRNLTPDFRALAAIVPGDVLFIATAPGTETDVVSRVFVPGAGIDEDPVTGSAHCLLTVYWSARLGRDSFTAYQASARGGHIACRLAGGRAVLGGRCVTVIEGSFTL